MNDHRWDGDDRGDGVADATALAPGVYELAAAVTIAKWVAEEPEVHLLPHICDACAQAGLELLGHELDGAVCVVRIAWRNDGRPADARQAAYRIVGSFAEAATSVRQRGNAFEVVTGLLAPDTPFKPHGHMVRIELVPLD